MSPTVPLALSPSVPLTLSPAAPLALSLSKRQTNPLTIPGDPRDHHL